MDSSLTGGRPGRLCLETGACFEGVLAGAPVEDGYAWGEVVFNTCMTGYQEVLSDPSYAGQMVVMTYPLIGNYGCRDDAMESSRLHCRALIVRELSPDSGHAAAERDLEAVLTLHGLPALTGVDTRALTRHVRAHGSIGGTLAAAEMDRTHQLGLTRDLPGLSQQSLVAQVSQVETVTRWMEPLPPELLTAVERGGQTRDLTIVCIDLGIKRGQLRALVSRGVQPTVLRYDAGIDEVLAQRPDGVVISNGPGDPSQLGSQVNLVRELLDRRVPLLGICLGHQILGQAIGATTSRLPFGHHGANHPVQDARTRKVYVTAQNHEFQVDGDSIPPGSGWYISERNLNDGSVEGLRHENLPAFSVQYHPEGCPGPQDRAAVFDEFLLMAASAKRLDSQPPVARAQAEEMTPAAGIRSVLVIGSGPVVIGQAAEFDYAGTQACRSLREEGVRVILVNSNPATIMTDDESAHAVYIEPLTVPVLERIIAAERPDGLLPTLGGQTGLNLAVALDEAGVLDRHAVRVLGTSLEAIRTAEDRGRFRRLLLSIGEPVPHSETVDSVAGARDFLTQIGLPAAVRPAFTLGGSGGGLCETEEQFRQVVAAGLAASPIGQVLVEESLAGWREIEYEVMRDGAGTSITVCNMENIDPMGVHTGDSIVVAPSQTLTDREHQQLRSAALRIINALGIEGGCNVQFALEPGSHRYFVIEVNPRVSRSSALASKATGYPIARVAAKIAIGKRLHEIPNAVTGKTTSAFEPALDYCVVKIPRWPFDKFPGADRRLGTQMKSTGEVMAIERTFEAALEKALRSLDQPPPPADELRDPVLTRVANDLRIFAIREALRSGRSPDDIARETSIGLWFLHRVRNLIEIEAALERFGLGPDLLRRAKRAGMSDATIAGLTGELPSRVAGARQASSLWPTYKSVDTCAAEFAALTPYFYSTFESEDEIPDSTGSIVVLGSGPIRIGQGIEFDYCSVQAAQSLRAHGVPAIMVNCNPETVSTDFDCSSRLYFEPLDEESAGAVVERERAIGVMVQFGGQTAINLADPLASRGIEILGTTVESIDLAEDRGQFGALLRRLGIPQPEGDTTLDPEEAIAVAERIGYPVLVRPSFVLGGRGMEIVYNDDQLRSYVHSALAAIPRNSEGRRGSLLVDKYLLGTEVDVDVVSDGDTVIIPGLMEHVELAGVHSGDSMAAYPATGLQSRVQEEILISTTRISRALGVRGLCNVQFVIHGDRAQVVEVNPRASRTVPFLSKVTGVPMVDLATRVARGERLADLGWPGGLVPAKPLVAVKAPVFSNIKLERVDAALGPEMKSTGEAMGIDLDLEAAVEKAFLGALGNVPLRGGALCSIADADKAEAVPVIRRLHALGFTIYATSGTALSLGAARIDSVSVGRLRSGRPSVVDIIEQGAVSLVINTVSRAEDATARRGAPAGNPDPTWWSIRDGYSIREAAVRSHIPCCTSLQTAAALVGAIERHLQGSEFSVATTAAYREGTVRRSVGARSES